MVERKPTRTISGVTPLAVVVKPRACVHGKCIYCPSLGVPESYTPKSPAIMRALRVNYNPELQVKSRLKILDMMKHPLAKIELILIGGTFLSYPLNYQKKFVLGLYNGLNNKKSKNLNIAKKINEKANHRCIGFCIETRPDVCEKKEIKRMLNFGITRCELGVQAPNDKIYRLVHRGHKVRDVVKATQLLKDSSFKVGYHVMPGLPGSNFEKDIEMFKELFKNQNFKPDQLKIYPTQVIQGTILEKWFKKNKYHVYDENELIELLIKIKKLVPRYCRIMRVMRIIPKQYLVAGTNRVDLRYVINQRMKKLGEKCRCIRCREIGFALKDKKKKNKIDSKLKLNKIEYEASHGKEIFLEFINKDDIIFGLIRLRISYKPFIPVLKNALLVRELHIYGPEQKLSNKIKDAKLASDTSNFYQHKGLGKSLMLEAEKIALKHDLKKIAVISGVGVRDYYRKLGYALEGAYMCKKL